MSSWRERQRLARRDPDLLGDEVDARDHLGDRVLDLQAGVHLEEEELAVLEEELDGAGVVVAARLGDLDRGLAHGLADLVGEGRRRRLSSTSFWWRRWAEQSRSPTHTQLPWVSPMICISTWRGHVR